MHRCLHLKFAYFLITKFEGNINMILEVWATGLGKCKYETNWELENVTFSGIWITSHWNGVYRTNKSWKSFTQIEFHFISIRFNSESWKSEVIFSYPKMAPLWVFCPKLSLNSSSSDVSPGGRQSKSFSKSFSKLHYPLSLSLLTKSFIFKIGCWWGVKPFSGGDQLK